MGGAFATIGSFATGVASFWHAIAGGPIAGIAALVLIYELIMMILALLKGLNHPARLFVVSILFTMI